MKFDQVSIIISGAGLAFQRRFTHLGEALSIDAMSRRAPAPFRKLVVGVSPASLLKANVFHYCSFGVCEVSMSVGDEELSRQAAYGALRHSVVVAVRGAMVLVDSNTGFSDPDFERAIDDLERYPLFVEQSLPWLAKADRRGSVEVFYRGSDTRAEARARLRDETGGEREIVVVSHGVDEHGPISSFPLMSSIFPAHRTKLSSAEVQFLRRSREVLATVAR